MLKFSEDFLKLLPCNLCVLISNYGSNFPPALTINEEIRRLLFLIESETRLRSHSKQSSSKLVFMPLGPARVGFFWQGGVTQTGVK